MTGGLQTIPKGITYSYSLALALIIETQRSLPGVSSMAGPGVYIAPAGYRALRVGAVALLLAGGADETARVQGQGFPQVGRPVAQCRMPCALVPRRARSA